MGTEMEKIQTDQRHMYQTIYTMRQKFEEIQHLKENTPNLDLRPEPQIPSEWGENNSKILTVVQMGETMEKDLLTGNNWFVSKSQNQEVSGPKPELEVRYKTTSQEHLPKVFINPVQEETEEPIFKKKSLPVEEKIQKSNNIKDLKDTLEVGFAGLEKMGKQLEESLVLNESDLSGMTPGHERTSEKVFFEKNMPSNFSKFKNRNSLKKKLISLKKKNKGFKSVKSEKGKRSVPSMLEANKFGLKGNLGKSLKTILRRDNSFKRRLNEFKVGGKKKKTSPTDIRLEKFVPLNIKKSRISESNEQTPKLMNFYKLKSANKSIQNNSLKNNEKSKPISSFMNFKEELDNQPDEDVLQIDDSRASIKYLVMNQYMEECHSDSEDLQNQEILRDLDEPASYSNTDKVRSAAKQINEEGSVDPWEPKIESDRETEARPKGYLNFEGDFVEYAQNSKNLLAFKACSLFSKNKLLEHPLIHVLCETSLKQTRSILEAEVTLTYIPIQRNFRISTRMITFEAVESLPQFLNAVPFHEPLVQCFSIKMIGCLKVLDFPKVLVSLQPERDPSQKLTRIGLPVPFTINKFVSFEKVSQEWMIDYVQNSVEIDAIELDLDDNLLVRAEDIIELLPNVVVFEKSLFCIFIDFGGKNTAALKVEVLGELKIRVVLYSTHNEALFGKFMEWFKWMFMKAV